MVRGALSVQHEKGPQPKTGTRGALSDLWRCSRGRNVSLVLGCLAQSRIATADSSQQIEPRQNAASSSSLGTGSRFLPWLLAPNANTSSLPHSTFGETA